MDHPLQCIQDVLGRPAREIHGDLRTLGDRARHRDVQHCLHIGYPSIADPIDGDVERPGGRQAAAHCLHRQGEILRGITGAAFLRLHLIDADGLARAAPRREGIKLRHL